MTTVVNKNANLSLNGSSIKGSRNSSNRPATSFNSRAKSAKQIVYRGSNEIERWAYDQKKPEDEVGYESDEIKSIDDTYLENFVEKDIDDLTPDYRDNLEAKRVKISQILRNIREHKKLILEMNKKDPTFNGDLKSYAIKEMTIDGKKDNGLLGLLDDTKKSPVETTPNDTARSSNIEKKKPPQKDVSITSIKFKASSNGMSRAMPGRVQQNITLERTYFKDLLKLSRQRYITKLNSDFQKRKFTENQARKGLCDPPINSSRSKISENSRIKSATSRNSMNDTNSVRSVEAPSTSSKKDIPVDFVETPYYSYKIRSSSAYVPARKVSTPINKKTDESILPKRTVTRTTIDSKVKNEESDNDAFDELNVDRISSLFRSPASCTSKVSIKSVGSSILSTGSKMTKHSNYSSRTSEEASVHFSRNETKVRSSSAYGHRTNTESIVKKIIEKQDKKNINAVLRTNNRPNSRLDTQSDFNETRSNTNPTESENRNIIQKSKLKRPNTSIAFHRIDPSKVEQQLLPQKSLAKPDISKMSAVESEPIQIIDKDPVSDQRYTSLLTTMTGIYVPKQIELTNADDRVRNLIRSNKALQSFDGMEKERKTRFEIDTNMKLFEKLITNYF